MWKKLDQQDDALGSRPEFASEETAELEAPGDALLRSLVNDRFKENLAVGPQKVLAQNHTQPLPSPSMTTYTEALDEFTKNATWFIEQLPLLAKARDAYERAMRTGAELRKVLDTGEENLQTLMTQLEQAVNIHGVKQVPDRKKPEPAKVELIRGTGENSGDVKRFP